MRIYDRELIINGKAVCSPEQQVYKNMKDIEELKNIITLEEEYACTIDLATTATTVAKSYTNAGEEVKSGWLIDPHANKFKITGGDDSNLLIEFYASYRGPAGASGASAIDDTGTASDKVWSSQKTNTEITNAKDKGIFYTTTSPSLVDGHYTIDYDDLSNITNVNQLKAYDLIIYINSGVPTAIYKVTSLADLPTIILEPVGTYAQGKTLYQHNILITVGTGGTYFTRCSIYMVNDISHEMTFDDLVSYLYDKGCHGKFVGTDYVINGKHTASGGSKDPNSGHNLVVTNIIAYSNDGGSTYDRLLLFISNYSNWTTEIKYQLQKSMTYLTIEDSFSIA